MKTRKRRSRRLQSDHPFYQFMQEYPRQMFELLGVSNLYREDYDFSAPVLKKNEFRTDGFYWGKDKSSPMIFIEINFYKADNIYHKTLAESWLIYSQTAERPDSFMFLSFSINAKTTPDATIFSSRSCHRPTFR